MSTTMVMTTTTTTTTAALRGPDASSACGVVDYADACEERAVGMRIRPVYEPLLVSG